MTDPLDTFRTEAREHLVALEEALLEMEESPANPDLIDQAFRSMHTIKGAGGMFGFDDLSGFTHHLETVFDRIRSGAFSINAEMIGIVLEAKDHIEDLLHDEQQTNAQSIRGQVILNKLNAALPESEALLPLADGGEQSAAAEATSNPETSKATENKKVFTWRITIKPSVTAFADGFDMLPIFRELDQHGPMHVTTYTTELPLLSALDAEQCYLEWDVLLTTSADKSTIQDTFIFVQDDWQVAIHEIDADAYDNDQLGEILVERGDIKREKIEALLQTQNKTGKILQDAGLVNDEHINAALTEQKVIRETKQKKQQLEQDSTVRVPTSKLDILMDLVGELVIVQARINQVSHEYEDEKLLSIAEELDRLSMNLRDNTFDIRMLAIGTTFSRFRRLVRDLSNDLGKEIKLVTEGAETELDKMVIDRLADPLVHLIRNSIDHGIELPNIRKEAQKPEQGTITLSAQHEESHVVIKITDDGAGLDPEKLRAKAVEKGIIASDTSLNESEIYNLIFEPGFSTAKAVTDVSGRGVGMDVVRRSIESLRGEVTIDSQKGRGSTVKIRLPMTLAIIEGLMVAVADEKYVLPLSAVEECIELNSDSKLNDQKQVANGQASHLIRVRDELVPYIRLRDWFEVGGETPDIEQIVLVNAGDQLFGFCIDEVVGQHQTVIKSLGKLYQGYPGLAGATILGDGGVAMIIDVNQLIAQVQSGTTH